MNKYVDIKKLDIEISPVDILKTDRQIDRQVQIDRLMDGQMEKMTTKQLTYNNFFI